MHKSKWSYFHYTAHKCFFYSIAENYMQSNLITVLAKLKVLHLRPLLNIGLPHLTENFEIPHHALTFIEGQVYSYYLVHGNCLYSMQLCIFTLPLTWNVPSSDIKNPTLESMCIISNNTSSARTQRILSSSERVCIIWMYYRFILRPRWRILNTHVRLIQVIFRSNTSTSTVSFTVNGHSSKSHKIFMQLTDS